MAQRRKILQVVLNLETGGLESGIVNIARLIDQRRFELHVVCLRGRGELLDRIDQTTTRVFHSPRATGSIAAQIAETRRLCRRHRYDVVHTHGYATQLIGLVAARLAAVPYVINSEHGTLYDETARQRFLQRWMFPALDGHYAVSEALRQKIGRSFGVDAGVIEVVFNGVDTERFTCDQRDGERLRHDLGLTRADFVIGSVGRLVWEKDYPTLLRGFAAFAPTRIPPPVLLLAGEGPERAALHALASELGIAERVRFLGRRDDIPTILNALDVFALTSVSEGLPNTLLEAMSCERAVVASDIAPVLELVEDGITGTLFPAGDSEQLAKALLQFVDNGACSTKIGAAARRAVVDRFSARRMVDHYQAVYARLIGRAA